LIYFYNSLNNRSNTRSFVIIHFLNIFFFCPKPTMFFKFLRLDWFIAYSDYEWLEFLSHETSLRHDLSRRSTSKDFWDLFFMKYDSFSFICVYDLFKLCFGFSWYKIFELFVTYLLFYLFFWWITLILSYWSSAFCAFIYAFFYWFQMFWLDF